MAGSGLHFPSHHISWRRQKKDTLELAPPASPPALGGGTSHLEHAQGRDQARATNGELCLLLGPEIGIPQCKPLKPLAGFTLVLSLNAAPSQGDRTQGKALVEKSKKSRERTSRRKDHWRGETHHTREKVEKQ